jgi:hypothetical protein
MFGPASEAATSCKKGSATGVAGQSRPDDVLDDSKEQDSMRKSLAAGAGLLAIFTTVAGTASAAQAASTAYPTAPYEAPYGATYTKGTITFYNRAAMVDGVQRALDTSGCRQTIAKSYSGSTLLDTTYSQVTCYSKIEEVHLYVNANVVGGATSVRVSLNNIASDGTRTELAWDSVPRP